MDIVAYIIAGAVVGFAVGMTGVGGGSLMTPILLLFGFPAHVAVGTDLLYAAVTKSGGVVLHARQKTVRWRTVLQLASGSIPASILTVYILKTLFTDSGSYAHVLTSMLGVMLILTALVLMFRRRLLMQAERDSGPGLLQHFQRNSPVYTVGMGLLLGVFVTLSSVGAGAFGAAVLMLLYPKLASINIVGTDIAHAVPLTLVAGIGHLYLGNVDFYLLGCLLIGSLPAIYLGTRLATRLPDKLLQPLLASMLLCLGLKYAFF